MSNENIEESFEALDRLLEAERAALLIGDLEKLTELLPQKEALIDALNSAVHRNLPILQSIDGKVKRNQLLLNGALEGIRSVSERLAALRQLRGSLETYGADGKKRNFEVNPDHSVEKRA